MTVVVLINNMTMNAATDHHDPVDDDLHGSIPSLAMSGKSFHRRDST
jgi:hypothetical protein